jgi:hypothetical protein
LENKSGKSLNPYLFAFKPLSLLEIAPQSLCVGSFATGPSVSEKIITNRSKPLQTLKKITKTPRKIPNLRKSPYSLTPKLSATQKLDKCPPEPSKKSILPSKASRAISFYPELHFQ